MQESFGETLLAVGYGLLPSNNGLFPRKGHIAVGSDADLVIWDAGYRGTMGAAGSLEDVDFTPHEGMEQRGRADKVFLRGMLTADAGAFVGSPGQGMWVKGEPFGPRTPVCSNRPIRQRDLTYAPPASKGWSCFGH